MGRGKQGERRGGAEEDPHRRRAVEKPLRSDHHDRQFHQRHEREEDGCQPVDMDEVTTAEPLPQLERDLWPAHPETGDRQAGNERDDEGEDRRLPRIRRGAATADVERGRQRRHDRRRQRRHKRNLMAVEGHRGLPCCRRPARSRSRSAAGVPNQSIHAVSASSSRSRSRRTGPTTNRATAISSKPRSSATR